MHSAEVIGVQNNAIKALFQLSRLAIEGCLFSKLFYDSLQSIFHFQTDPILFCGSIACVGAGSFLVLDRLSRLEEISEKAMLAVAVIIATTSGAAFYELVAETSPVVNRLLQLGGGLSLLNRSWQWISSYRLEYILIIDS